MCNDMIELKNAKGRIIELEGEMKTLRKDDLEKKIGASVGHPVPEAEVDECTCPDNYIISDDTDAEPSEDEWIDEAGADIMESSTDRNF